MKNFTRILCLALVAVMLCVTLASCGGPASDPDKAEKALKDENYIVLAVPGVLGNVTKTITATKISEDKDGNATGEFLQIIYYKDKDAAKEAFESVKKESDAKSKQEKNSDWVCKRSGAMIYFGTKNAVKDAK